MSSPGERRPPHPLIARLRAALAPLQAGDAEAAARALQGPLEGRLDPAEVEEARALHQACAAAAQALHGTLARRLDEVGKSRRAQSAYQAQSG